MSWCTCQKGRSTFTGLCLGWVQELRAWLLGWRNAREEDRDLAQALGADGLCTLGTAQHPQAGCTSSGGSKQQRLLPQEQDSSPSLVVTQGSLPCWLPPAPDMTPTSQSPGCHIPVRSPAWTWAVGYFARAPLGSRQGASEEGATGALCSSSRSLWRRRCPYLPPQQ